MEEPKHRGPWILLLGIVLVLAVSPWIPDLWYVREVRRWAGANQAILSVLITGILVFVTWRYVHEARRTADATYALAEQARDQSAESQRMAEATLELSHVASEQLRVSQMALELAHMPQYALRFVGWCSREFGYDTVQVEIENKGSTAFTWIGLTITIDGGPNGVEEVPSDSTELYVAPSAKVEQTIYIRSAFVTGLTLETDGPLPPILLATIQAKIELRSFARPEQPYLFWGDKVRLGDVQEVEDPVRNLSRFLGGQSKDSGPPD